MPGKKDPNFSYEDPKILSDQEKIVFKAISESESIGAIKTATRLSSKQVRLIIGSARLVISANDTSVDDFLQVVENWSTGGRGGLVFAKDQVAENNSDYLTESQNAGQIDAIQPDHVGRRLEIVEEIEQDWTPSEIRDLGGSLIRLADALDQNWDPENVRASYHWPSAAAQIERNAVELAKKALLIKRQQMMRKKFLPDAMLGEPTWNMLLDLFCQFAGGAMVSSKSLCLAADCPETTALRYIDRLENCGLVERFKSDMDRRLTMIQLTKKGVVSVGRALERLAV